jgi:hypothetical protein
VSLPVPIPHNVFWTLTLESPSITLIIVCYLARRAVKIYCFNCAGFLERGDVFDVNFSVVPEPMFPMC